MMDKSFMWSEFYTRLKGLLSILPLRGVCTLLMSGWFCYACAQELTLVELNCENLFDCLHDSLKNDYDWLPASKRRWTQKRYRRKAINIAQEIISCKKNGIPDLVALTEVENDSVLHHLTRFTPLRAANYEYIIGNSGDLRGINLALLYHPSAFQLICYDFIEIEPYKKMRPTRDILYVRGKIISGDTLHLYVVHAPSKYGGERRTIPYRQQVMNHLIRAIQTLPANAKIIVCGDFNDEARGKSLAVLPAHGLQNITAHAKGRNGKAFGTYKYQGLWQYIDHVFVSANLLKSVRSTCINDDAFLLEQDNQYGGWKPFRTYNGYRYQAGFSDHLSLVVTFGWD